MNKYIKFIYMLWMSILFLTSCSDNYLDTVYRAGIEEEELKELIREYPDKFKGLVNGIYSYMVSYDEGGRHDSFNFTAMLHGTDMMCQDIAISSNHYFSTDYLFQDRNTGGYRPGINYAVLYTIIANVNRTINLLPTDIESDYYTQGLGELYALRAMSYYYLIQLYQQVHTNDVINFSKPGVPIYLEDNIELEDEVREKMKGRNTVEAVLEQIETDLAKAMELLEQYDRGTSKSYINTDVVHGLSARYYLLTHNWDKAIEHAAIARVNYPLMNETALFSGFNEISNEEWMWGFDHNAETQTTLVSWFSHISNLSAGYAGILSARLIDYALYHSIPDEDIRKELFNGPDGMTDVKLNKYGELLETAPNMVLPYANIKFGWKENWTQDYPYMRAAEMYLIEAEAYAHKGEYAMAAEAIRPLMENRQPGWDMSEVELEYVYWQRRIELWGEGFSYFDLKRLYRGINRGYPNSNHTIAGQFVVPAGSPVWTFQIPLREIQNNDQIQESDQND